MRPKDKTLLARLGLKPADDKGGLILHALHMLEGYALNVNQRVEETEFFISAKIMLEECGNREPALIAAQLIRPIAVSTDPKLTAKVMGPRVAEILKGLYDIVPEEDGPAGAGETARLIKAAEPAVRHSLLATHTGILEDALEEHGGKPLIANVTREVQLDDGSTGEFTQSVREFFKELSGTLDPLRQAAREGTGEPRLEARFLKALHEIDAKLATEAAPGFGAAFRFAAGFAPEGAEPAAPAPGRGKPPGPAGMLN